VSIISKELYLVIDSLAAGSILDSVFALLRLGPMLWAQKAKISTLNVEGFRYDEFVLLSVVIEPFPA
jgi:hypothetical protein